MTLKQYRSKFNTWKRSREAFEVSRSLIRKALYLCPICKFPISLGEGHLFHIIPIKLLSEKNEISLVISESNLLYSCKTCNLKQRDNIYTECLENELLDKWNKIK
jgi:5-methylcytosine-specific restriction endonuclease McrA